MTLEQLVSPQRPGHGWRTHWFAQPTELSWKSRHEFSKFANCPNGSKNILVIEILLIYDFMIYCSCFDWGFHKHMDVRQGSAWESWIVFAVDHIDKPGFFPRRLEDWILVCCTTRYVEGLLCQLHQSCMHVLHATALSTWYLEDFGHEPTRVHALACVCDLTGRFELNIGRHRFNMLHTPHICLSRKLSMDRSLFFSSHGSSVGCLPSPMVLQES